MELHQRVDEPARGRCARVPVLDRHDDEEPAAGNGQAALGDQALDRLLQGLAGSPQRTERFLTGERVAAEAW
jgi:hypothetical protein